MKRNLWQIVGRDVLYVIGGQLYIVFWDRLRGGGIVYWVMGFGVYWEVGFGIYRDCIWSYGYRGVDRYL